MANDKEWERRSDEWVKATHKSRLKKEAAELEKSSLFEFKMVKQFIAKIVAKAPHYKKTEKKQRKIQIKNRLLASLMLYTLFSLCTTR